jgi:hypothetical protein
LFGGGIQKSLFLSKRTSLRLVTPYSNISGTVGFNISNQTPVVSSRDGALTYSISPSLPSGLSLNTSTGVISGMPMATLSSTTYTVTVTDIFNQFLRTTFNISVAPWTVQFTLRGGGGGSGAAGYLAANPQCSGSPYQVTYNAGAAGTAGNVVTGSYSITSLPVTINVVSAAAAASVAAYNYVGGSPNGGSGQTSFQRYGGCSDGINQYYDYYNYAGGGGGGGGTSATLTIGGILIARASGGAGGAGGSVPSPALAGGTGGAVVGTASNLTTGLTSPTVTNASNTGAATVSITSNGTTNVLPNGQTILSVGF